jgi:hypothetical protein
MTVRHKARSKGLRRRSGQEADHGRSYDKSSHVVLLLLLCVLVGYDYVVFPIKRGGCEESCQGYSNNDNNTENMGIVETATRKALRHHQRSRIASSLKPGGDDDDWPVLT